LLGSWSPSPIPRDRPNCSRRPREPVRVVLPITDPTGSAQLQPAGRGPGPGDRRPSPIPRDRPNCSTVTSTRRTSSKFHHRSHGIGPIAAPERRRSPCGAGPITDPTGSAQLQLCHRKAGVMGELPITDPTGSAQLQRSTPGERRYARDHHRSHGIGPIAAPTPSAAAPAEPPITDPTGSAQLQRSGRWPSRRRARTITDPTGSAQLQHQLVQVVRPRAGSITDPTGSAQLQHLGPGHRVRRGRPSPIPRDRPNCSRRSRWAPTAFDPITDPTGSAQLQRAAPAGAPHGCDPSPIPRDRPNCSKIICDSLLGCCHPSPIPRDRPNCSPRRV